MYAEKIEKLENEIQEIKKYIKADKKEKEKEKSYFMWKINKGHGCKNNQKKKQKI